jgi:hypothetical protein
MSLTSDGPEGDWSLLNIRVMLQRAIGPWLLFGAGVMVGIRSGSRTHGRNRYFQ